VSQTRNVESKRSVGVYKEGQMSPMREEKNDPPLAVEMSKNAEVRR
jgi:hypothetical protein